MKTYVVSGGPGVGKTSVINELKKQGYKTIPEAARELALSDERFIGKSISEIEQDSFQEAIFLKLKEQWKEIQKSNFNLVFLDRGIGDLIAYDYIRGVKEVKGVREFAKKINYNKVFILDTLPNHINDFLRTETKEEAKEIHNKIIEVYEKELGCEVIVIPFMTIKERVDFILANLD